jgi:hypothetical protein
VKDRIRDKTISLEHIGTKDMVADPLTKGLPPNVLKEHLAGMGFKGKPIIPGLRSGPKENRIYSKMEKYVVAV